MIKIIDKLKKNKGVIIADALLAVVLMMIFLSIISTVSYSIYITSSFIKRNSKATDYGVKIIEWIDKTPYSKIDEEIINYINGIESENLEAKLVGNSFNGNTPYKATIEIQKYNETEGNTEKKDIIKTIIIEISYNLGEKTETVKFERLKTL